MVQLLLALVYGAIALAALGLLKTYQHVPAKELKRLARGGDQVAEVLYKPVAYGMSLTLLLWFVIGIAFAGSVVVLARSLPVWLTIIVTAAIVWIGFLWIPAGRLTKAGVWSAKRAAPPLAWLLDRLHPLASRLTSFIRQHRPVTFHTGLYEKNDLVNLLENQKTQADNRIASGEIELLQHALTFGDKQVADVLIPKRVVTMVPADESIGPSLMAELHKSGHSRFPVYDTKKDNIVGVLYLRDLVASKQSGKVSQLMKKHLTYVHEDFTLYRTLQAFIKTKQHLFFVVNSFEELVGIITIEDIIEQMVGKLIIDEFDTYDDLRAVAVAAAKKEHATNHAADTEVDSTTVPDSVEQ